MRNAIARSAILAAGLALAVGCTGEHGTTIGPPHSTEPSAGGSTAQTAYISVVRIGDALLTTTSDGGEATAFLNLALRLAGTGARRAACLRSGC